MHNRAQWLFPLRARGVLAPVLRRAIRGLTHRGPVLAASRAGLWIIRHKSVSKPASIRSASQPSARSNRVFWHVSRVFRVILIFVYSPRLSMIINRLVVLASIAALLAPLTLHAQYQPGSTGYNTVVVPGNSLGKHGNGSVDRWGALSRGADGKFGWSSGEKSEREARARAQDECIRSGGTNCKVEGAFVNSCGALAWSPKAWALTYSPPEKSSKSEREADALERCGAGCRIVRSDCSL